MKVTHEMIQNVVSDLIAAEQKLYVSAGDLAIAKEYLQVHYARSLYNGTIDQKNDTLREAAHREMFEAYYKDFDRVQNEYAEAKYQHTVATLRLEAVKMMLRVDEIIAGEQK